MSGEPSWFEIGVADAVKAREFYGGLLGWEFESGPSGDDTEGGMIRTAGIDGGLHGGDEGASPYLFFGVGDLDAALERVKRARRHGRARTRGRPRPGVRVRTVRALS